jgi:hypothetical protein
VVFRDVDMDPSRHMFLLNLLVVIPSRYMHKILRFSCTPKKSTCPQVGASCYPSFCMRPTLVNFFTTLVIFITKSTRTRIDSDRSDFNDSVH